MTRRASEVSRTLQREVRAELQRKNVSADELAKRLGLLPVGAEVLLAREQWTLETALELAEAVGLDVELKVSRSA